MTEEDPDKRVDEDWKRRAREEKEKDRASLQGGAPAPEKGQGDQAPPRPGARGGRTPFMEFVNSLATEALIFLGAVAHPQTGEAVFAPEQAKHVIDVLHLLGEKTRGNLTPEEDQLLKSAVHELRLAFVEATMPAPPPPPRK